MEGGHKILHPTASPKYQTPSKPAPFTPAPSKPAPSPVQSQSKKSIVAGIPTANKESHVKQQWIPELQYHTSFQRSESGIACLSPGLKPFAPLPQEYPQPRRRTDIHLSHYSHHTVTAPLSTRRVRSDLHTVEKGPPPSPEIYHGRKRSDLHAYGNGRPFTSPGSQRPPGSPPFATQ
eukprot:TRINITY_DN6366_c0_g1_i1.p2 TRINITY_DN6366_c0_g1~~TRINITY_DN6366_c0_g1_i1.p2  ORF type:complete len:202 (-),score=20.05 TRINITY_DN6366_c0_g1_i1:823-1353(-)